MASVPETIRLHNDYFIINLIRQHKLKASHYILYEDYIIKKL